MDNTRANTPLASGEAGELIAALEQRIASQRERGGDMLTYGTPDSLDTRLLAFLSAALTPAMDEQEVAQALQDHMEQFHGVVLKASEWDAAARAAITASNRVD